MDLSDHKIINYLGVDWGEKRIGLAVADSENKIAVPAPAAKSIAEVIKKIKVEAINVAVIGIPNKMDNQPGNLHDKVVEFVRQLYKETNILIKLTDERLTSKMADSLPGNKKSKASRDSIAAMLILQNYLDRLYNK